MGTISSSTGLISGIDIQGLVSQLMQIEARPLTLVRERIAHTQSQQTAYLELGARLLAAKSAIHRLSQESAFTVRTATSSNDSVLTVSADENTPIDSYSFIVRSLVTSHQLVSAGFADRDTTPVGPGTLTFEVGQGQVNRSTQLSHLNGFAGIRRGVIRITDRSGASAEVDLRAATDVDDVLEAINSQTGIAVEARVDGDHIAVSDRTGLPDGEGRLTIVDVGGGFAARDLGIDGVHDSEAIGESLVFLTESAQLSVLNDGLGVRVNGLAADMRVTLADGREIEVNLSGMLRFGTKLAELNDGRGIRADENGATEIRVTNRNGDSQEISLTGAETIQDVVDRINEADLDISVALSGGKLLITDGSGGTASNLVIEDVTGHAAEDLGILADTETNVVTGSEIYRVETVGAVFRAIEHAEGNDGLLTAQVSSGGKGIMLIDQTAGPLAQATVEALNDSQAALDLGLLGDFGGNQLESRDLIAGLNTVLLNSLNGGNGVDTGTVEFTLRDGTALSVDLSGAQTLQTIVDRINDQAEQAGVDLVAAYASGGTGITITDGTAGTGMLQVSDLSGTAAADLNLTSRAPGQLVSGDLQRQYVNERTLLADLHQGEGIDFGEIRITDSSGRVGVVTLLEAHHETIGDVIDAINALDVGVTAGVNDDGDGIKLEDTAGGSGTLKVEEDDGGSTGADLGILGTADGTVLQGSFAVSVEIDGDDTLDEVVAKINAAGAGVTASVINDGTGVIPYRLRLASNTTGLAGDVAFSTGSTGLSLGTLTEASDAVVVIGDPNSSNGLLVTSSSNTLTDVVEGLTINLLGTSDDPVQVTVTRDRESVVSDLKTFITTFNDTMDRVNELTRYIPESEERGILLGDHTIRQIESRIFNVVGMSVSDQDLAFTRLSSVGVMIDSSGGLGPRLTLQRTLSNGTTIDGEARLREALEEDPDAVMELFTRLVEDEEGNLIADGIAARLDEALDEVANQVDGTITQRNETLQDRVDLLNRRAGDMQKLLDAKEARLYAQFQAMERALAAMQSQQDAVASLAGLVGSLGTG